MSKTLIVVPPDFLVRLLSNQVFRLADYGIVWYRHTDRVRRCYVLSDSHCEPVPHCETVPFANGSTNPPVPQPEEGGSVPQIPEGISPAEDQQPLIRSPIQSTTSEAATIDKGINSRVERTRRYPQRVCKPPHRYTSDWYFRF